MIAILAAGAGIFAFGVFFGMVMQRAAYSHAQELEGDRDGSA